MPEYQQICRILEHFGKSVVLGQPKYRFHYDKIVLPVHILFIADWHDWIPVVQWGEQGVSDSVGHIFLDAIQPLRDQHEKVYGWKHHFDVCRTQIVIQFVHQIVHLFIIWYKVVLDHICSQLDQRTLQSDVVSAQHVQMQIEQVGVWS